MLNYFAERKLVIFKLAYNESCPDDYEPPMFILAPSEWQRGVKPPRIHHLNVYLLALWILVISGW